MPYDVTDFQTLMALESHGPDVYVGIGPAYPWGGLYGGQVVAQALRAACHTVGDGHFPHSLHAYFIRAGDTEEPIRFEVDRIRNGRSFLTRRVVARQSIGPILNLSASFQIPEPTQSDAQTQAMPDVAGPGELEPDDWGPVLSRRSIPREKGVSHSAAWLKIAQEIGDDPILQACGLAYASDDIPTEAASMAHPHRPDPYHDAENYSDVFVGASLDHAIWFHRPGRHDEWVLHDFMGHGVTGARGLAIGQVYAADGVHLASVVQEALIREKTR